MQWLAKNLSEASFSNFHFLKPWLLHWKRLERGLDWAVVHGDGGNWIEFRELEEGRMEKTW